MTPTTDPTPSPTPEGPFRLHLNGGPRDDTYMEHWTSRLEVLAIRGGISTMLAAEAKPIPTETGFYEMRVDANGDPVPHNLQGFVEADWKGWS